MRTYSAPILAWLAALYALVAFSHTLFVHYGEFARADARFHEAALRHDQAAMQSALNDEDAAIEHEDLLWWPPE